MPGDDWFIEFETTQGDELSLDDMKNATWKVVETYFDIDEEGHNVLTHRVEIHSLDALNPPITAQDVYDWEKDQDLQRDWEEGEDGQNPVDEG